MLISAGGILGLLQNNADVKQGTSTYQEIKAKLTQFALRNLDMAALKTIEVDNLKI